MPLRVRSPNWEAGEGAGLVRWHRQGVFRQKVRGEIGQHRADHRVADDLHSVRGRVRGPDDRNLPGRCHRHQVVDDARGDTAASSR